MHLTSTARKTLEPSGLHPVCADAGPRRNVTMDENTRRKIEMGKRALEFSRAHPDPSPEYAALVARLEALLARAEELEKREEQEQKLRRKPSGPASKGKVLPFELPSRPDPTDPAA
jgi:hypothetical protein